MSNKQMLKIMINERLSEAAEEIFALFEQSVAEYQREIDRLKQGRGAQTIQTTAEDRDAAGNEEDTGVFCCKEETEQVAITRVEDEPEILTTKVESLHYGPELQPHGQRLKSEGAGANNCPQSSPESEGDDSITASDEELNFASEAAKKTFSCSVTGFLQAQQRDVQMQVLPDERPLTSAACNFQLDRAQNSLSQPDTGPPEARPFSCPVCHKRFKQIHFLRVHIREHDGGSLFQCTECSAVFAKEAKFFRHMKTVHSIEKPFKCSVCGKCLKTAHAYRTHMLIHTGERPFKCSVCGKGFVQKVSLKNHMVTHSGEKPFSCVECGKNYSTSQSLMIHNRLTHR